jgi:hypothetical protein
MLLSSSPPAFSIVSLFIGFIFLPVHALLAERPRRNGILLRQSSIGGRRLSIILECWGRRSGQQPISLTGRVHPCQILAIIAPPTAIDSVRTLSAFARTVRRSEDLEWCDSRLRWKANRDRTNVPDTPFRKLALAALDLLTSEEINKLSACSNPECHWLFLDGSKNKGRRWCDMKLCGYRIKA